MPAIKNVMKHLSTEVAGRRRKCYRQPAKHAILKGELCLVVKDGPQSHRTYCGTCAAQILSLAQDHLTDLTAQMFGE